MYKVAKILGELCSVVCKVELVGIQLRYLAEEISSKKWKVQLGFSLMLIVMVRGEK